MERSATTSNPKTCYANSDFDVQNVINSNFIYQFPAGRGRMFASNVLHLVNELIGS